MDEPLSSNQMAFEPEIQRLMKFYDCNNYRDLVHCMATHIERLQEKLPPTPDQHPRKVRFA